MFIASSIVPEVQVWCIRTFVSKFRTLFCLNIYTNILYSLSLSLIWFWKISSKTIFTNKRYTHLSCSCQQTEYKFNRYCLWCPDNMTTFRILSILFPKMTFKKLFLFCFVLYLLYGVLTKNFKLFSTKRWSGDQNNFKA